MSSENGNVLVEIMYFLKHRPSQFVPMFLLRSILLPCYFIQCRQILIYAIRFTRQIASPVRV